MKSSPSKRYNKLAPCGVYCGACPSFNKSCKGCSSEDTHQNRKSKWGCKIRNCCYYEKKLDYCAYCDQFPCQIFDNKLRSTHQNDPRFTYRYEIPKLVTRLKSMSVEAYLEFQKQRWTCDVCGGTIQFYVYKCKSCRKEQMINGS